MSKLKFFQSTNNPNPAPAKPQTEPAPPPVSKYVPNYVQLGIEPIRRDPSWVPNEAPVTKPIDEDKKSARFQQIYEQLSGQNAEQSFHLDTEIEQFGNIDLNHPMIDNQKYTIEQADTPTLVNKTAVEQNLDVAPGDFVLYLDGEPLCAGSREEIETMTSDLVFGKSNQLVMDAVDVERLSVFQKIDIKMGLFLG